MSEDRHDNWARQSAALSRAYEMDRKEKTAEGTKAARKHKDMECAACKKEKPCLPYRQTVTDRNEGSASFAYESRWLCDECAPPEKPSKFNPKQVKSMLRNAKRGRL